MADFGCMIQAEESEGKGGSIQALLSIQVFRSIDLANDTVLSIRDFLTSNDLYLRPSALIQ